MILQVMARRALFCYDICFCHRRAVTYSPARIFADDGFIDYHARLAPFSMLIRLAYAAIYARSMLSPMQHAPLIIYRSSTMFARVRTAAALFSSLLRHAAVVPQPRRRLRVDV